MKQNNNGALTAPIKNMQAVKEISACIKHGDLPAQVTGCLESQESQFIAAVSPEKSWKVIITYNEIRARQIADDQKTFYDNVYYYPARDLIFYSADIHSNAVSSLRLKTIEAILTSGQAGTVVTTMAAGLEMLQKIELYKSHILTLKAREDYVISELAARLLEMGYDREIAVVSPGTFSIRGEIVDIFPISAEVPVRLDFFDTEIESIHSFDIDSQRSIAVENEAVVFPASEIILDDDDIALGMKKIDHDLDKMKSEFSKSQNMSSYNRIIENVSEFRELLQISRAKSGILGFLPYFDEDLESFFDYFNDETVFFIDDPYRCFEQVRSVETEFNESMESRLEKGYILPDQFRCLMEGKDLKKLLAGRSVVTLTMLDTKNPGFIPKKTVSINVQQVQSYFNHFDLLLEDLKKWTSNGFKIIVLSASHTRAKRLESDFKENGINSFYHDGFDASPEAGQVMVTYGHLSKGFMYPSLKYAVVSEGDIFGTRPARKKAARNKLSGEKIASFSDLKPGDYIVHENHGIGLFRGIEKIKTGKAEKDYIKIEYSDEGILYVPASNLDVIQKFADANAAKAPKLNKLSSQDWSRTKSRVRSQVRNIAKDLVRLYSLRQNSSGYAFSPDTVWQKEFEELFPYTETDDQLEAIDAVKRDMESTRIMDRLICGDVGYGKTEVALRAAFKCVMDGKQAAILVPTTILAQQHYNTFTERIGDFPVKIRVLSRMKSAKENNETIRMLKNGEADIVIGTHKLLSKDVSFKDLGLLIIDEEQRFGVTHKEKIKQMRGNVDVLALSATPIPRTLHMSLIGVRDMSVLEEPPALRMPVQTFVLEHDDEIIREAVTREAARGGQIYYVYNRIDTIGEEAAHLKELMPEVNIACAHGRMNQREVERIMMSFISGEIDMLISTTIIETGIDIPNVNTIIVDNADRMGLSQLYQLRGRVGRSNRIAYAFLMYRKDKILSETAEKRLNAIKEFTDLGSGIKVAVRDLEIRGAGNILGAEQSGHMGEVGYDLYCKMLNQAVAEAKNEADPESSDEYDFETTIELKIDAYIPDTYIKTEFTKLEMYKKISLITSEEEFSDMEDELRDRFGPVPAEAENLLKVALIKNYAHNVFISRILQKDDGIKIMVQPNDHINADKLARIIKDYKGRLVYKDVPVNPYLMYYYEAPKVQTIKRFGYTKKITMNPAGATAVIIGSEELFSLVMGLIKDMGEVIEADYKKGKSYEKKNEDSSDK
jgi:transcription-repair coupling factor (superfamily II helicase)